MEKILAIVLPGNSSSIRLLEKVGFRYEKNFISPDTNEELCLYSYPLDCHFPRKFSFLLNFIFLKFDIMNTATCYISKKKFPVAELYKGRFLKKEILDLVKKDFPGF